MSQMQSMMQQQQPQQIAAVQQQPQQQQQQAVLAGGGQSQPPAHDIKLDSLSKVKSLIWPLKESLSTCMRVAAANITHNAAVDAGAKGAEQQPMRFDKCLEDFYAICDQVELNLVSKSFMKCWRSLLEPNIDIGHRLHSILLWVAKLKVALDCSNLATSSQRYTPFAVVAYKPDNTLPESHNYNQLINVVKMQVDHAKEIHDYLTNAASTISNSE